MIKHKDSHVDHGLTDLQLGYVLGLASTIAAPGGFEALSASSAIIAGGRSNGIVSMTIELPEWLGTVPCGLYGPIMSDPPVTGDAVVWAPRGSRTTASRLVPLPPRPTNKVTVIAGPHDGHDLVLYTAFGGPKAPREVHELVAAIDKLVKSTTHVDDNAEQARKLAQELTQAQDFWATHALALPSDGFDAFHTWTVELSVKGNWVAEGFELTTSRALKMLANDLSYAYERELRAKVIRRPDADEIARVQGYKSHADKLEHDAKRKES